MTCTKCDIDLTQSTKNHPKGVLHPLILCVVVVFLFVIIGGRGYKSTVKQYLSASLDADAKEMISLMPKEYISYGIKTGVITSKRELIADTKEVAEASKKERDISYGKGWKYDYKITNIYRYDAEELDMYKYYNDYIKSAKAAMEVDVELTIEDVETFDMTLLLLKIGSKWYVADMS